MADELVVNKAKFDKLLRKMLETPPLPKADIRVANPKPNKNKGVRKTNVIRKTEHE
jgi:hypothetical protein